MESKSQEELYTEHVMSHEGDDFKRWAAQRIYNACSRLSEIEHKVAAKPVPPLKPVADAIKGLLAAVVGLWK